MDAMYESMGNSSPHTRRYFRRWYQNRLRVALFSAHAEVFPGQCHSRWRGQSLLRTRGGISELNKALAELGTSSPHTRRYFRRRLLLCRAWLLFSAHAEVFPLRSRSRATTSTLLRTRGGISYWRGYARRLRHSSPHTRRYFQSHAVND